MLPDELLVVVFGFLGAGDLARCAQVCVHWHDLAADAQLWRRLFLRQFRLQVDGRKSLPYAPPGDLASSWRLGPALRTLSNSGHGVHASSDRYRNWKDMYATRHNWAVGNCCVSDFDRAHAADGAVRHLQFTRERVFASDGGTSVRVWDVATQAPCAALQCSANVCALRLAMWPWSWPKASRLLLLCGLDDGTTMLWDVTEMWLLAAAAPRVSHDPIHYVTMTDRYIATVNAAQRLDVWACDYDSATGQASMRLLHSLHSVVCAQPVALELGHRGYERDERRRARLRLNLSFAVSSWIDDRAQHICSQRLDFTEDWILYNAQQEPPMYRKANGMSALSVLGPHAIVNCLRFEATTQLLVSGHGDNTIHVWAATASNGRFEHVRALYGHTGAVTCLEFDGFKVVSGSRDHTIKLWSLETGECQHTFSGHDCAVTSLVFDEQRICSGDERGQLKLWSFRTAPDADTEPLRKRRRLA